MERGEGWGMAAAALSSLIGGTAVATTRFVVAGLEPLPLVLLRFAIGATCLLPLLLLRPAAGPRGRDLALTLLLGVWFFALFPWLFTLSLARTTAARGALALSTLPILTLVVAALAGMERFTGFKLAGVVVALAGVTLALSGRLVAAPTTAWLGDLLMVATALCGAVYNVAVRPLLRRYDALVITGYGMAAGALALLVSVPLFSDFRGIVALSGTTWIAVIYLGIAGAAVTFMLWSWGLSRTTPTRVAITVALNPVGASLLGIVLLEEPVPPRLVLGLLAVIAGILLASRGGAAVARR